MSTPEKIKITLDLGKILAICATGISVVFYAGKLDQKVDGIQIEMRAHEIQDAETHKSIWQKSTDHDNKIFQLAEQIK